MIDFIYHQTMIIFFKIEMVAKVHFFLKARTSDFVLSWTCQLSHISSSSPSSPTSKPAKDLKYPMHTLHARLASATSAKRKYWSIFKKRAINTNPQQKYTFAKISGVGCSPIVKSDLRWHDLPRNLHPQQVLFSTLCKLMTPSMILWYKQLLLLQVGGDLWCS